MMAQIISEIVTFEELEKLGSELDASPASKSTLPDNQQLGFSFLSGRRDV